MAEFTTRRNDTKPLTAVLKDSTKTAVNLAGATVVFSMVGPYPKTTKKVNRGAVTITDAAAGEVSYPWQTGETNESGLYYGEFEVTYADTTKETFPAAGQGISIRINPDKDEV